MPVHRRITALLAALTTMAGGSFVSAAAADADSESAERGARPTLSTAPSAHASAHRAHADQLAGALGVSDERLGVVLRELRIERRTSDLVGARPAIRTPQQLAEERTRYVEALAAKVGVDPDVAAAALDGARPPRAADA